MERSRADLAGWSFIVCACALVFLGNLRHSAEQGIFAGHYVPLARALIEHGSYAYAPNGPPAFYPMWGYAFVLAALMKLSLPPESVLLLQFGACLVGLAYAYRLASRSPRAPHALLLVPYFAVCSVKWPLAFVAALVPVCVHGIVLSTRGGLRPSVLAGLLLALLVNMRPELLLFLFLATLWALARRDARIAGPVVLAAAIALISLVPWAVRSFRYDGALRFGSTNLGGVLYISLGQLPENPWGVEFSDESAYARARRAGIGDPWSPEGDRVLKEAFLHAVRDHPAAYARKLLVVALRAMTGGVYTGEYDEWVSARRKDELKHVLSRARSSGDWRPLLSSSDLLALLAGFLEKLASFLFRFVWLIVLATLALFLFLGLANEGRNRRPFPFEAALLLVFVATKFLVACFIQYQPRHLTEAYLCALLAAALLAEVDETRNLVESVRLLYEPRRGGRSSVLERGSS